jgi:hypothetical protein
MEDQGEEPHPRQNDGDDGEDEDADDVFPIIGGISLWELGIEGRTSDENEVGQDDGRQAEEDQDEKLLIHEPDSRSLYLRPFVPPKSCPLTFRIKESRRIRP